MLAMLATPAHEPFDGAVLRMVDDPNWAFDVKVDGVRLLIHLAGRPTGYNRSGQVVALPRRLEHLLWASGGANAYLDGELVGERFWAFDIIRPGHDDPWIVRRLTLGNLLGHIAADPEILSLVPVAYEHDDKAQLAMRVRTEGLEGLVAKRIDSKYRLVTPPQKAHRSREWLKLKDLKTVDCVVTRLGVDGKQNMALGLWRDDSASLVEVGEVSALTGDGPRVKVRDVVEVTFLYLGVNNRLVQPVTPRLRPDKSPAECTWDQLPPSPGTLA